MQKLPGWTAGSKTRKLKGLNAKNRAKLEILLNYMDCGLISMKGRVSFAKSTGVTVLYRFDSGPVDMC